MTVFIDTCAGLFLSSLGFVALAIAWATVRSAIATRRSRSLLRGIEELLRRASGVSSGGLGDGARGDAAAETG